MDIIENLQSTIHMLKDEDQAHGYYIEEISFRRSPDHDFWLGRYGSEKRTYLGE